MKCEHGREHTAENQCPVCMEMGDRDVVNMSVWGHLTDAAVDFFYFRFHHVLVDLVWFVQKLTNTGDFGPKGYFTEKGYWKDGKPTKSTQDSSPH